MAANPELLEQTVESTLRQQGMIPVAWMGGESLPEREENERRLRDEYLRIVTSYFTPLEVDNLEINPNAAGMIILGALQGDSLHESVRMLPSLLGEPLRVSPRFSLDTALAGPYRLAAVADDNAPFRRRFEVYTTSPSAPNRIASFTLKDNYLLRD